MYTLLRPILFSMEPEQAHEFTLSLLQQANKLKLLGFAYPNIGLPVSCMGMTLPNPVGLAAGLDKNGAYIDALAELGFGFIEIGTITPRPQAGNPKPRLFRVKEAEAIINRMGFNNEGVDVLVKNVQKAKYQGVLGINIGKNKDTPNDKAIDDYVHCLERVYPHASYITINISSPNTKNLRELQSQSALAQLLDGIKTCHSKLATSYGFYVPLALKIAPDLDETQIDEIAKTVIDFEIDGLIATNTTLSRRGVEAYPVHTESGGLSGRPLSSKSTEVLGEFYERLSDKVDLIGVGGVYDVPTAIQKFQSGAKAIQVYSGLIYKGPRLVYDCLNGVGNYLEAL